jgi:hypothetical protein
VSFEVRLVRKGAPPYVFETTPFLSPEHGYEYDLSLPPRLVSVTKTWALEGVLYANMGKDLDAAWDALKAAIEDPKTYPEGIELVRGGVVCESISVAGGYEDWRIQRLALQKTDLAFRGELRFTMRVSGRRRVGSDQTKVTSANETETWTYDEAGLLTRTLQGEIEVASGSAVAEARKLGLKLPGDTFAFVTNGPEGVDVERLDPTDRKARFTCVIKESGAALPKDVGPSFVFDTETQVRDGVEQKTTRVVAHGPGALAAVQAKVAPGRVLETISVDKHMRTAQGVFVESKPAQGGAQILRVHRLTVAGGNRPRAFTKRTGARRPVEHTLAYTPITVTELIEIRTFGKPSTLGIKLPSPVKDLVEDRDAWRLSGPERTVIGRDETGDEWTTRVTRVYRATSLEKVFTPVFQAAFVPGAGTSLEDEVARIVKV